MKARFTKAEIERLARGMRAAGFAQVEIVIDHCGRISAKRSMQTRPAGKSSWDDYRDKKQ